MRELIGSLDLRHESLSMRDYHARPELGSSTLKCLSSEGAEITAYKMSQTDSIATPSRALVIGSAIHAVMDDTFEALFSIAPEGYKTADSDKFEALRLTELEAGKSLVTTREFVEIASCGESLKRRIGVHLIGRRRWKEASLFWTEPSTICQAGIACKCRPDDVIDNGTGGAIYLETKSAHDCSERAWRSAAWRYGYYLQQPHYEAGIRACGANSVRTIFVVVRKSPPHDVRFYELSLDDRIASETRWRELVEEYARRVRDCDWVCDSLANPTTLTLGVTSHDDLDDMEPTT